MSIQVTLTLPDKLYQHAQWWATMTEQELSSALTEALTLTLTPLFPLTHTAQTAMTALSDDDVLALSQLKMQAEQGERLSLLLGKQREGQLTQADRDDLLTLVQIYGQLWIRQSEALAEAVKRGLRPPLDS